MTFITNSHHKKRVSENMTNQIEKFEDLKVWKKAMRLATNAYKVFKESKSYALRDQIIRSAISVPSNIAEGYERNTNIEFIQFLYIAKASCAELRTQFYIALEVKELDEIRGDDFIERTRKISAMLFKLIKTRKEMF